jgi:uncharacterized RDD family membrane protein YckC
VMFVVSLVLTPLLYPTYDSLTGATSGLTSALLYYVVFAIVFSAIIVVYDFVLTKSKGQTVGKMALGIKIVQVGGQMQPGGLPTDAALKRSLLTLGVFILYAVPIVGPLLAVLAYVLNGTSQLWDKPLHQTFADKFGKTVVVKVR